MLRQIYKGAIDNRQTGTRNSEYENKERLLGKQIKHKVRTTNQREYAALCLEKETPTLKLNKQKTPGNTNKLHNLSKTSVATF